ncbi:MAG: methyltransferase domain-containing protein [Ardenticatenia bacterium]|nr:methyltransferase domain-containing protein [Ardenticatenia bacterium]
MNIHRLYRPFLRYFRTKRMRQVCRLFGLTEETRVLDVGGYFFNWSLAPTVPSLTILNLNPPISREDREHSWVVADRRHLPFKDGAFDIVYSNSVIEHLGGFANQQAFAREIARVGIRYYVQTPNRWFPVEPHLLTPLIHYLPKSVQKRLLRNFTVWGLVTRPTDRRCEEFLQEVRLLDERELRQLFPDADILHERVLGFTKSLIAIRT